MQYGQIVFILFILLLLCYAGMIVMDLMQAKAAQAAEHDNQTEEDIDITDEAETFRPIRVSRDDSKQKQTTAVSDESANDTGHTEEGADSPEKAEDETEEENEEEAESGEEAPTADNGDETTDESEPVSDENLTEQPVHTPGYREAIMTDGIEVEKLLEAINRLALNGTSVLGAIIYSCETME